MKIEKIKEVYFLGIGGIGMSALARYFKHLGKKVSGYDRSKTPLIQQLINEDIFINFEDSLAAIPESIKNGNKDEILIIITPAIPMDSIQLNYLQKQEYNLQKRAAVLGLIAKETPCIAVAGTHGKTTTSTLIAHVLKDNSYPVNAFLGGISSNYQSNLILSSEAQYLICEADEFDRSFLHLYPEMACITSIDADHLDIYLTDEILKTTYLAFAQQVEKLILIKKENQTVFKNIKAKIITYSLDDPTADYFASNIQIKDGQYIFDLKTPTEKINHLKLGLPGKHNVENAVAAFALLQNKSIPTLEIQKSFENFKGIKRRFEQHVTQKQVYIDDYAHHPTELRASILSAKEMYPDQQISGIFQPHLFSRTRDFLEDFASALSLLDELILLDIYPARELPIAGISSQKLLEKVSIKNKKILSKEATLTYIEKNKPAVLLTLGAGDIDQLVEPIIKILQP